jgi:hypothetical protein
MHFGRKDHFRRYGRDFAERLEAPGFSVEAACADGPETVRHGLIPGECIYICRKPAGVAVASRVSSAASA